MDVAALFQCYIEEVVKLFDSLVHGCYSGSYFVEIHFIIWPLRGGYRYPLRGGDSTILYLDSILSGSYVRTLILTIALLILLVHLH